MNGDVPVPPTLTSRRYRAAWELTTDSRITTYSVPFGFYGGLCPAPCLSSFIASTRLARHAASPPVTRDTTGSSTTTEPDRSGSLGETWKRGEPTWPPATQANARPHIHPNGNSDNPIPLTPGTRRRGSATSP